MTQCFKSKMFNGFNARGLTNQKLRVAYSNTVNGRSSYDLMCELLGVMSVQLLGVGRCCALLASEISAFGPHHLQTLQCRKCGKNCTFLIRRRQLHSSLDFSPFSFLINVPQMLAPSAGLCRNLVQDGVSCNKSTKSTAVISIFTSQGVFLDSTVTTGGLPPVALWEVVSPT